MKKILISLCVLLVSSTWAFSQSEVDAYRLSLKNGLNGTARYVSMGGAFGALGGDISVMSHNPAGLAIYRSSEIATTLNLNMIDTETKWGGVKMTDDKTRFNFNNIAYVGYVPTGSDYGLKGWNFGFAYKRVKDFNRKYTMGTNGLDLYSLSDYAAILGNLEKYTGDQLNETNSNDPWHSRLWLPTLAYNAGIIKADDKYLSTPEKLYNPFGVWEGENKDDWAIYIPESAELWVEEKGAIDNYDFSFAFNVSDRVFFGATFNITDIHYKMFSGYYEYIGEIKGKTNDSYLNNFLQTNGTGYGFNLGVLLRASDYIRLGVAYNSPTWYNMKDEYDAAAGSRVHTEDLSYEKEGVRTPPGYTDYKLRTPDRWIFSIAGILGQRGLISLDYELTNYKNMKLDPERGHDPYLKSQNEYIKDDFSPSHTIKLGAEYKVTPQFAIRAGGMWQTNSVKSHMKEGRTEVATAGTRPHYTLTNGLTSYYTFGLGYRFTPNFYTDLACTYGTQKDEVYAFSSLGEVQAYPGKLTTNNTNIFLTFGYKF